MFGEHQGVDAVSRSESCTDVVQAWFQARASRDVASALARCSDDVEIRLQRGPELLELRGRAELSDALMAEMATLEFFMEFPVVTSFAAEGEEGIAALTVLAAVTTVADGGPRSARWRSSNQTMRLRVLGSGWRISRVEIEERVDADYDTGWGSDS